MQDGQGETGDKKSEVKYEASRYPVRPEKTRCRCFCPSELSRVTINVPCPNFKACHLVFCPFQHMKKDFLDDRVAKRGKGVDDLVMVRLRSASSLDLFFPQRLHVLASSSSSSTYRSCFGFLTLFLFYFIHIYVFDNTNRGSTTRLATSRITTTRATMKPVQLHHLYP